MVEQCSARSGQSGGVVFREETVPAASSSSRFRFPALAVKFGGAVLSEIVVSDVISTS